MDKVTRIVAAALVASGVAYATPAFSVQTTAEEFVLGLSSDFSAGNHAQILVKLQELKQLGFEGILFDNQIVSIDRLIALLNDVQNGVLPSDQVAASLLAHLQQASLVSFVGSGIVVSSADLSTQGAAGSIFPAGSAG